MSSADDPQLPATIVVTPMRTKFSARGVSARSSACVWTSMKPGATINPAASMTSAASRRASVPIAAIFPLVIATSARRRGAPVPSTT